MQRTLSYILLFIVIGCGEQPKPQKATAVKDSSKINTPNIVITTADSVVPFRKLPTSFVLDSINFNDTNYNYSGDIYFPRSSTDSALNKAVQQFIKDNIMREKADEKTQDATRFDIWLKDIRASGALVHFLFRAELYRGSSAL